MWMGQGWSGKAEACPHPDGENTPDLVVIHTCELSHKGIQVVDPAHLSYSFVLFSYVLFELLCVLACAIEANIGILRPCRTLSCAIRGHSTSQYCVRPYPIQRRGLPCLPCLT